jgi:hypothetical protein
VQAPLGVEESMSCAASGLLLVQAAEQKTMSDGQSHA